MARIAHLVRIDAQPEIVFEKIATTSGLEAWFTEAHSAGIHAGGSLELRFGGAPVHFEITEFEAPARMTWRCTSRDDSWFDTRIAFELEADPTHENARTIVRFDHLDWPEVTDRFRDCSQSWAYFLESLKSLVEDGRGTPEQEAPPCESTE